MANRAKAFARRGARVVLPRRGRRRTVRIEMVLGFLIVWALGYIAVELDLLPASLLGDIAAPSTAVPAGGGEVVSARFARCAGPGGTCVIDGDTIRVDGVSVRIADIDTPEVRGYQCASEQVLGQRATDRMIELVNAGPFAMRMWDHRDTDVYGRKLRVLERDGRSLGMVLVAEGLAREWGGRRESWCAG